jgi:hypothetical protein
LLRWNFQPKKGDAASEGRLESHTGESRYPALNEPTISTGFRLAPE